MTRPTIGRLQKVTDTPLLALIAGPRSRTSSTWSSRPGITPSPWIGPPSLRGGRRSRSPKRATDRPRAGSPALGGDQQPKLPREGVAGGSIRSLPRALLRITTTTKPPGIPSRVRPTRVGPRGRVLQYLSLILQPDKVTVIKKSNWSLPVLITMQNVNGGVSTKIVKELNWHAC